MDRQVNDSEDNENQEEEFNNIREILSHLDPTFVREQYDLLREDPAKLQEFVGSSFEKNNYPTMADYMHKQNTQTQYRQYLCDFSVQRFLTLIPDPKSQFPKFKLSNLTNKQYVFIVAFLENKYKSVYLKSLRSLVIKCANLEELFCELEKYLIDDFHLMKRVRISDVQLPAIDDIPLIQEIMYYSNKSLIEFHVQQQSASLEKRRAESAAAGLLLACSCCCEDQYLEEEMCQCPNACLICKTCVRKSVEIAFAEGKLSFQCVIGCKAELEMSTLQSVLPPKLFSRVAQKKQIAEIRSAGLEELEGCPFCDFATIPVQEDKVFHCMNPDCMKESCRLCKEPSHIPLRCDEIEKDENVRARVYVEDKMTEALLRTCNTCKMRFFKVEGCNKMTCPGCGANMCYLCRQTVKDYSHFNGDGGDKTHLCPLWTNTTKLDAEAVLKVGEQAKQEVEHVLKSDPTKGLPRTDNQSPTDRAMQEAREWAQLQRRFAAARAHRRQQPQANAGAHAPRVNIFAYAPQEHPDAREAHRAPEVARVAQAFAAHAHAAQAREAQARAAQAHAAQVHAARARAQMRGNGNGQVWMNAFQLPAQQPENVRVAPAAAPAHHQHFARGHPYAPVNLQVRELPPLPLAQAGDYELLEVLRVLDNETMMMLHPR